MVGGEVAEQFPLDAGAHGRPRGCRWGRPPRPGPAEKSPWAVLRSLRMMSWRTGGRLGGYGLSSGKLRWIPFSPRRQMGLVMMKSTRPARPISHRLKRRELRDHAGIFEAGTKVHLA